MPRTSPRGGPETRRAIARVADGLFVERGFDSVTVAEVAKAAGVSSVTVFKHFPRKEDLFLDRSDEALELVRAAVRERREGTDVVTGLHEATTRLLDERHPLTGLDPRSLPFFRTVAGSPALSARAREIAAEARGALEDELGRDSTFAGDPVLVAALFVGGYVATLVATAGRVIAGERADVVEAEHRARLDRLFALLA